MATITLPANGGCRCDRLRFVVDASPLLTSACHCSGCQRMTGGPYALTVTVSGGAFRVTSGEPVVGGRHGPEVHQEVQHWHCAWCKSWVYTAPVAAKTFVNVRATMLDEVSWFSPFLEVQTAEKLPFAATGAPHSFVRNPDAAGWANLVEAYRLAQ